MGLLAEMNAIRDAVLKRKWNPSYRAYIAFKVTLRQYILFFWAAGDRDLDSRVLMIRLLCYELKINAAAVKCFAVLGMVNINAQKLNLQGGWLNRLQVWIYDSSIVLLHEYQLLILAQNSPKGESL
jgi:hypothetical protein